ncbi:formylglycine-generating enzyme family protein [Falsiruegeria mediterranea]
MAQELPKSRCCPPATEQRQTAKSQTRPIKGQLRVEDAVSIPGGTALVGTNTPIIRDDGEDPLRKAKVKPFRVAATAVTNAQFQAFVEATGYVTEAERIGWSFVFWSQLPAGVGPKQAVPGAEWWRREDGANWRDINGPGTQKDAWFPDHPVVQVSWNDAQAYAAWVGGRLPTEAEWEHAARGGLGEVMFPWGDQEPNDTDFMPCNIWQGQFPKVNTGADGYLATAPARSFEPNGYGLYNVVGNVWEWTSEPFRIKSLKKHVRQRLAGMKGFKLSKGGSYLCHRSYCYRYRVAARSGTSPDSATTHHGFRIVWPMAE